MKVSVFGGRGWIGSHIIPILESSSDICVDQVPDDVRIGGDMTKVREYLCCQKPTHVLCLIGRTWGEGYNSVDYLELPGKLVCNMNDNLYAPISLALLCKELGIHYTYVGTGCIYENNDAECAQPFEEMDVPNFYGSSYSIVKGYTDLLMKQIECLNVRIRMPISTRNNMRNFITKIASYKKILSMPNSVTVLPECLPYLVDMMRGLRVGTINLVNPGYVTHNQVLTLYRDLVDPCLTWENHSEDEQNGKLLARRSNCLLDTQLLLSWYPNIKPAKDAIIDVLSVYNKSQRE